MKNTWRASESADFAFVKDANREIGILESLLRTADNHVIEPLRSPLYVNGKAT